MNSAEKFHSPDEANAYYKSCGGDVACVSEDFKFPLPTTLYEYSLVTQESMSESSSSDLPSHSNEDDGSSDVEADKNKSEPVDFHTVKFNLVIGSTKEKRYQDVLERARDAIESGQNVAVELCPEPTNPVDSQAIAFICKLNGKEYRIGYVVRENLP